MPATFPHSPRKSRASIAVGVLRHHGPRWVASRLILEAQKQLGWEARVFPPREWRVEEWRHWVNPELAASTPQAVWTAWRNGPGAAWGNARRTG